ncbi:hypothetical protein MLGJGCBP_03139 [Rhodococcus sp. T7]|nr:hypothetical protein MLGJGCBP_03139 [Rhodococcus sp. T7]
MKDPLARMIRIDRNIRTTGFRDRVHTDDKINRPPNPQAHQRLRTHTLGDKKPRKTIHPNIELTESELLTLEHHRHRTRRPRHLRIEQRHQRRTGNFAGGAIP